MYFQPFLYSLPWYFIYFYNKGDVSMTYSSVKKTFYEINEKTFSQFQETMQGTVTNCIQITQKPILSMLQQHTSEVESTITSQIQCISGIASVRYLLCAYPRYLLATPPIHFDRRNREDCQDPFSGRFPFFSRPVAAYKLQLASSDPVFLLLRNFFEERD